MIFYDLKKEAARKSTGDVAGRDAELRRIARTLQRQYNGNVLVRGKSGVGKTALVEGFAYRVALGKVVGFEDASIVKLDTAELKALLNGSSQQTVHAALSRVPAGTIVFIDDFGSVVPDHKLFEVAQVFEPLFTAAGVSLVITVSDASYAQLAAQHPAFFQNFEDIELAEVDAAQSAEILSALSPSFSASYGITVPAAATKRVAELSARVGEDKRQPLRAMHLLDEALAYAKISGLMQLDVATVEAAFSEKTGIPNTAAPLYIEDELNARVIGQREAVGAVAEVVRRSRIGLRNPNRPYGSFLFLGPSGVGKTELSRVLAELVYGSERAFTRIDMSEFAEAHTMQRLIGAPPGYVGHEAGGQLTNVIKSQPYSLVLLDEIEKANPRVFDIFLQVLEDGRLTDGSGKTVNFTNTTIIATSNIGIDQIVAGASSAAQLMPLLLKHFRTEFLNRFDGIIVFKPLTDVALLDIALLEIKKIEARTAQHKVKFDVDNNLLMSKIKQLADPRMGARPIKRFIEQTCEGLVEIKVGAQA